MTYTAGPFITPHLYVQWGGKLPGSEQWSCGLRMAPRNTGPWPATDAAANLTAISTAISAFHTRVASKIDTRALLSFCKVNMIGVDGHYVLPTTNEHIYADIAGGGGTQMFPNQVALAVTLQTAFSRGPAHQGRFYLPLPATGVGSNGAIDPTDQSNVKGSANTLLTALNAVSASYGVSVFSRKLGSPAQNMVTGIKVGGVLDTQRRRRRSMAEAYV
jgi:hypothetical protein